MACLDENQVLALVHGRLASAELSVAQQHLDQCPECLELVGFYQQSAQEVDDNAVTDILDSHPKGGLSESDEDRMGALPGALIGRYEVLRSVGRGGMGVVYLARDPELDRRVALKLVKPSLQSDERADHFEKRLMREARAMAKLAHPNVLTIYDVGIQGGQVFLASEWVDGTTLAGWIEEGAHRWPVVVSRFIEAAKGLVAAHAAGLIHRDFKPSNVMVGKDERVRVFDFGLVRASNTTGDITTQLSGDFVVGTPAYMSPEQMVGKTADERSDQFSFCASLYEAVAGVRPFSGRNLTELLLNIGAGKIAEPEGIPKWLWEVLKRGLQKHPDERYTSMAEVLEILENGLKERRQWRRFAIASAVVAAALGGVTLSTGVLGVAGKGAVLCADLNASLVWSEGARKDAKETVSALPVPHAAQTWKTSSRLLDEYASGWNEEFLNACIDTRAKGRQSEAVLASRGLCLARLSHEFGAFVSQLPALAPHLIISRAEQLTPIATCTAVLAQQEFGGTTSGGRFTLETGWAASREVQRLLARGKNEDALSLAERTLKENSTRETEAQLYLLQGAAEAELGDIETALKAYQKAFYASVGSKQDLLAAQSSLHVVSILSLDVQDTVRAERWKELAAAAVERANSVLVSARWQRVLGRDAQRRADLVVACEHFQASVQLYEQYFGKIHGEVATSLDALGTCQLAQHRIDQAKASFQRALDIHVSLGGASHPNSALAQVSLSGALVAGESSQKALDLVEEAVVTLISALGEDHAWVAKALNKAALYQAEVGEFEEANRTLLRALGIKQRLYGNAHPGLVPTLMNLMDVDRMRGHYGDVVIRGTEAIRLLAGHLAANAVLRRSRVQLSVSEALLEMAEPLRAQELCLQLRTGDLVTHSRSSLGRIASCLGRAAIDLGRAKTGQDELLQAIQIFGVDEAQKLRSAAAHFALARSMAKSRGTRSEAHAHGLRAHAYLVEAGPMWAEQRLRVDTWLQEQELAMPPQ